MRVAVCQVAVDIDDPAGSLVRALRGVAEAAAQGAQLVVLPELVTSGYVFADGEEAATAAEGRDGPLLARLLAASSLFEIVLVAGWAERDGASLRNSAVVCDDGRLAGVYRKAHLWGDEPDFFTAGDAPPLVLDTTVGRVGVMVCYDAEFPEWVRMAAEAGAEVIACPVNWPLLQPVPEGERPAEVLKLQGSAASYRVPIAVADRCGTERGVAWIGGSCLIGVDGYAVVPPASGPAEPRMLIADLEPPPDKSVGHRNHAVHDRRSELYT